MLTPKKKISKRELKQDTLITSYMKATSFYEQYRKQISIGITAVVVVIIALALFFKNQADNNERAVAQLAAVRGLYDAGQFAEAIDGVPAQNLTGLKAIVDEYGSTQGGELAAFYLADAYYQLGKYQEALDAFERSGGAGDLIAASRLAGIAACHEALGSYEDAGTYFQKAAADEPTEGTAAEYLNHAARNFALAGEKEHALEILKRLKKDYPTTSYGRDAERFIAQLSV